MIIVPFYGKLIRNYDNKFDNRDHQIDFKEKADLKILILIKKAIFWSSIIIGSHCFFVVVFS